MCWVAAACNAYNGSTCTLGGAGTATDDMAMSPCGSVPPTIDVAARFAEAYGTRP